MTAVIKRVEFMDKVGVGIYINDNLSTFIINAVDLLDKMEALKTMGYELEVKHEKNRTV